MTESEMKNLRQYNTVRFLKKPFCRHKKENVAQIMTLPYGSKVLFVCEKCGRARITIC